MSTSDTILVQCTIIFFLHYFSNLLTHFSTSPLWSLEVILYLAAILFFFWNANHIMALLCSKFSNSFLCHRESQSATYVVFKLDSAFRSPFWNHPRLDFSPDQLNQNFWSCDQAIVFFKSSPGDLDGQLGLRTTDNYGLALTSLWLIYHIVSESTESTLAITVSCLVLKLVLP